MLLYQKHAAALLSFEASDGIKRGCIAEPLFAEVYLHRVELENYKPLKIVFQMGKYLRIDQCLNRWEGELTTTTQTNYDE